MRKITCRPGEVAERWRRQYERNGVWTMTHTGSSEDIHRELCALGSRPKSSDVDRIIGNRSWTTFVCEECRQRARRAVIVADGTILCGKCVASAASLLGGGAKYRAE